LRQPDSRADDCQGESGTDASRQRTLKPFEINILTLNPKALKILQNNSAEAAPVKTFRGVREGGTPGNVRFTKMNQLKKRASETPLNYLSSLISTVPPKRNRPSEAVFNQQSKIIHQQFSA
jgi:hypothetical protein